MSKDTLFKGLIIVAIGGLTAKAIKDIKERRSQQKLVEVIEDEQ